MKASEIYLTAAAKVERKNHGACVAIHHSTTHRFPDYATWRGLSREALAFQRLFCPFGKDYYFSGWLHDAQERELLQRRDMKRWRVLALCFMAAIAADEETPKRRLNR